MLYSASLLADVTFRQTLKNVSDTKPLRWDSTNLFVRVIQQEPSIIMTFLQDDRMVLLSFYNRSKIFKSRKFLQQNLARSNDSNDT